ncbi:hypothetical protein RHMOL_Rhmol11G0249600 [Rhododendron molle]|uniref:Uncharacterized protein n=1 Tax=Rhododendron molle TaxID=49168 RepID=A0ACC0LWX9_RHOML|nr:hypothetical protein RHMOL_Rhmol11G0249600 [Rhododendron molle]
MGLEWMLRLKDNTEREPATTLDQLEEPQAEEICPLRQLCCKARMENLTTSPLGFILLQISMVRKAVEELWGSMGQLAVSVASRTAASSRAHLHAINNRKRGLTGEHLTVVENHNEKIPGKVLRS